MFKDFHRRLQRDIKKIVDARLHASEARVGGELKVRFFCCVCNVYLAMDLLSSVSEQSINLIFTFIWVCSHIQWK